MPHSRSSYTSSTVSSQAGSGRSSGSIVLPHSHNAIASSGAVASSGAIASSGTVVSSDAVVWICSTGASSSTVLQNYSNSSAMAQNQDTGASGDTVP